MRISAINNCSKQNFQGLWGKTSKNIDIDEALGVRKEDEVKYYYPFKDEDPREAYLLVQGIKHAYIDEKEPAYYVNDARVCATLPFTEAEYLAYKSLQDKKQATDTTVKIHEYVANKYLNAEYGVQQSAQNPNLDFKYYRLPKW